MDLGEELHEGKRIVRGESIPQLNGVQGCAMLGQEVLFGGRQWVHASRVCAVGGIAHQAV
jgi:hypothetical protein